MAKANVTYVDAAKFELVLLTAGVSIQPMAGFVKVVAENGHRMYIAKTKRVGRIDLAFPMSGPGFTTLKEGERSGAVEAQVDFSQPEDVILASFSMALDAMKKLPKEVKIKAAKAAAGTKPTAQGWSAETLKATKAVTIASDDGLALALKLSLSGSGKPLSKALLDRLSAEQRKAHDAKHAAQPAPLRMAADKA